MRRELEEAQEARAIRLTELRHAAAQVAVIGEYYKLRARSARAREAGPALRGYWVDGAPWLVPGVAGGFAGQVPAPGDGRRDARVQPRADHPDALDRPLGVAVDAHRPRDERAERNQVVNDQGDQGVSGVDVAELAGAGDRRAGPADPEVGPVELEGERDHVGLPACANGGDAGDRLRSHVGDLLVGERHDNASFGFSGERRERGAGTLVRRRCSRLPWCARAGCSAGLGEQHESTQAQHLRFVRHQLGRQPARRRLFHPLHERCPALSTSSTPQCGSVPPRATLTVQYLGVLPPRWPSEERRSRWRAARPGGWPPPPTRSRAPRSPGYGSRAEVPHG